MSRAPRPAALYGAFFACALIWGSTFLVIRLGIDTMPPLWSAALRHALAAPLLVLIAAALRTPLPAGAARRAAVGYGLANLGVAMALLYWAETRVPSGLAAVFYATIPLTSTFMTRAFGLEAITPMKVGAAAVALAGVVVIFAGQVGESVPALPLVGLFVAATLAGLGTVLLKRGPRQHPIGANAVAAMAGGLVCLAASFAAGEPHPLPRTAAEVGPIVYLTLSGSIGAFVLFTWLVNHWDVTRISFVSVIVPVVALILGAIVLGERMSGQSLFGSGLVVAGVLLRITSDRAAARAAARP